ncbi:hypothetical protein [Anaerocolumna xylanovorans]|uniref:Uncharacterized protein n=1 Tax=Anaerocolumna xylanovorans DSM 12503 TaxID=1121345 RepID=A0A1M7Y3S4_9FIRM|nr:hypothetical protein [Anaerocolumna xylanovorans]SHO46867.1 hypothetical protein SAMN02745217_01317 [Anaerocolumna xylanovorans DSM 12503]
MNLLCNRPTYNRIEISLPTPPGVAPLPSSIYFNVDTRFTDAQILRIRQILVTLIGYWRQHYEQKAASSISQWAESSQKHAVNKLTPLWYRGSCVTNGLEATNFAMDILTQRFIENGTGKVRVAKIKYCIPKQGEKLNIHSKTAIRKNRVALNMTINPQILDNTTSQITLLDGAMIYAWYHRMGYVHPKNTYISSFIAENPMCLMREFQDKTQNEDIFTKYLD